MPTPHDATSLSWREMQRYVLQLNASGKPLLLRFNFQMNIVERTRMDIVFNQQIDSFLV